MSLRPTIAKVRRDAQDLTLLADQLPEPHRSNLRAVSVLLVNMIDAQRCGCLWCRLPAAAARATRWRR